MEIFLGSLFTLGMTIVNLAINGSIAVGALFAADYLFPKTEK